MNDPSSALRFALGVLLVSLASHSAAQQAPEDGERVLEQPVLLEFSAADYPAEAASRGLEASVVLKLLVDVEGHVSEVEVVTPAGNGFDEAATAAAQRFTFTPARRDGTAIAARIRYTYEFHLPPPAARPESEQQSASQQPNPPAPVASAQTPPPPVVEVTVQGESASNRLRHSAEAVKVIDLQEAKQRGSDLGDVLKTVPGVNVRRSGGLGSEARLSLNGLSGDQVRLFVDGLPLELAGYPFGIANVPVNLLERIEIYSGVVPIRFGADALGGAVNLVTARPTPGTHGAAAYEFGSFETQRVTLDVRHLHEPSGFFARFSGLLDYAKNDYPVNLEVSDDEGRLSETRIYRFHDAYNAESAAVELGFVDRPWAQRLILRPFVSRFYKEYQSNLIMSAPYGGLDYRATTPGLSLQYEQPLAPDVSLDAAVGYAYTSAHTLDKATCFYDWFGRCIRDRDPSAQVDSTHAEHAAFSRVNLAWRVQPAHVLSLALAPSLAKRSGSDGTYTGRGRDPLTARRDLWTLISGLQYQGDLFEQRLENIVFVKQYLQALDGEEVITSTFKEHDHALMRFGAGGGVRFRASDWLWLKASYEYATRLPSPEEVFGDNVLVGENLDLQPETSHNANLTAMVNAKHERAGELRAGLTGFLREAEQLIMLLGSTTQTFQNVYSARSLGVEAELGWTSLRKYVALDLNSTYQDLRNTSQEGPFVNFAGDRIPSQPYLFVNGSLHLQFPDVIVPRDRVVVFWNARYVHAFFRSWESLGQREDKDVIPSQLVHTAGLGYSVQSRSRLLTANIEAQNLSDERVYDYFGAQRPGRAFYTKITAEF